MPISTIRSTMLCLSGFELYSRWVPLIQYPGLRGFQENYPRRCFLISKRERNPD